MTGLQKFTGYCSRFEHFAPFAPVVQGFRLWSDIRQAGFAAPSVILNKWLGSIKLFNELHGLHHLHHGAPSAPTVHCTMHRTISLSIREMGVVRSVVRIK